MERVALLNALLGLRLFGGMLLGLVFGTSIRLTAERRGRSRRAWIGQVAPLALPLAGAAVMIWFVPPYRRSGSEYLSHLSATSDLAVVLAAHGLGVVVGTLSLRRCPVPRRSWGIVLLDALVFITLFSTFVLAVFSHPRVPIETMVKQGFLRRLVPAASFFALLLILVHHFGLTGRWSSNWLTLLSILIVAAYQVPGWIVVMNRGMRYTSGDMNEAFVAGIDRFMAYHCIWWPLSLGLDVAGLFVTRRRADRDAVAFCLTQLVLLALRIAVYFW